MASQKYSYIDYLNEYEAIMSDQNLVKNLLKAPIICKKKSVHFNYKLDAAQSHAYSIKTCRSVCKDGIRSSVKARTASLDPKLYNARISRFEIQELPKITKSSRVLFSKFVIQILKEE